MKIVAHKGNVIQKIEFRGTEMRVGDVVLHEFDGYRRYYFITSINPEYSGGNLAGFTICENGNPAFVLLNDFEKKLPNNTSWRVFHTLYGLKKHLDALEDIRGKVLKILQQYI